MAKTGVVHPRLGRNRCATPGKPPVGIVHRAITRASVQIGWSKA